MGSSMGGSRWEGGGGGNGDDQRAGDPDPCDPLSFARRRDVDCAFSVL